MGPKEKAALKEAAIHIQDLTEGQTCRLCGGKVKYTEAIITLPSSDPFLAMFTIDAKSVPAIMLFCERCGHLSFYSAKIHKVTDAKEQDQKDVDREWRKKVEAGAV